VDPAAHKTFVTSEINKLKPVISRRQIRRLIALTHVTVKAARRKPGGFFMVPGLTRLKLRPAPLWWCRPFTETLSPIFKPNRRSALAATALIATIFVANPVWSQTHGRPARSHHRAVCARRHHDIMAGRATTPELQNALASPSWWKTAGAGGNIGADVARRRPTAIAADGNRRRTASTKALYSRMTFDPQRDFAPITVAAFPRDGGER
jgi:hypothetical protein